MECTIIRTGSRDELIFGRQELTGIDKPRFFQVPEAMIEEIVNCDTRVVQSVIEKIKATCPELF